MNGTRNKVIHEYDSVQLDIIWDIVQKDLPALSVRWKKSRPPPNAIVTDVVAISKFKHYQENNEHR